MKHQVALILLAGVFLVGCNRTTAPGTSSSSSTGSSEAFSGSLKAAIALGVPMKCTYQVDDNEYEGYIQGQQYAGKMSTAAGVGNVIIKDNCMWTWQEGTPQGVTTCFEPTVEGESSIWDDPSVASPEIDYNCLPAVVTEATFAPPANVSFMDIDALMNGQALPQM